jgi:hypothetical protein
MELYGDPIAIGWKLWMMERAAKKNGNMARF